jgi:hypothetical protein
MGAFAAKNALSRRAVVHPAQTRIGNAFNTYLRVEDKRPEKVSTTLAL